MLVNGGFESGSFSPGWTRTMPNGACTGPGANVTISAANTGSYGLKDGSIGCADQISQSFMATAGQVYAVSFYIKMGGSGSGILANVTLF